jgi:PKHD-type hydroxylase
VVEIQRAIFRGGWHAAGVLTRNRAMKVHPVPNAFAPEECGRIIALVRARPADDARLVGLATDHNLRRAELVWVDEMADCGWITDRLIDIVRSANRDRFGFDLNALSESPQVARYGAERQGHFDWHSDIGDGPVAARRKLTVVVQLSDPNDYEGGALELMPGAGVIAACRDRGAATVFPSFLPHRVTPVTCGERHSLTIWAHGPAFR